MIWRAVVEKNKEKEEKRKPENECREQTVHAARTPSVTVQWLGEVNAEHLRVQTPPARPALSATHAVDPFHDKADENFQHCLNRTLPPGS